MSNLFISNDAAREYPKEPQITTEKTETASEENITTSEAPKENENVLSVWTYDFKSGTYDKTEIRGTSRSGLMINRGESSVFLEGGK